MKSKLLFPYFIDFVIIIIILAIIFSATFAAKSLLYSSVGSERRITVTTEPLPKELKGAIFIGDAVYDNLTKRRLGTIDFLLMTENENCVKYEISFVSTSMPRGDSMRTKNIWFRFYEVQK